MQLVPLAAHVYRQAQIHSAFLWTESGLEMPVALVAALFAELLRLMVLALSRETGHEMALGSPWATGHAMALASPRETDYEMTQTWLQER